MLNTEFVDRVKELVGTPYEFCDCKDVICQPLGIRMSGTNWLWRSINNSSKYRYLTKRLQTPRQIDDLSPGDILFEIRDGIPSGYDEQPDVYHVCVYIGAGKIVHSSPKTGVRVDEYSAESWQGWGQMKQVEYEEIPFSDLEQTELTDHEMITAIYNKLIGGND